MATRGIWRFCTLCQPWTRGGSPSMSTGSARSGTTRPITVQPRPRGTASGPAKAPAVRGPPRRQAPRDAGRRAATATARTASVTGTAPESTSTPTPDAEHSTASSTTRPSETSSGHAHPRAGHRTCPRSGAGQRNTLTTSHAAGSLSRSTPLARTARHPAAGRPAGHSPRGHRQGEHPTRARAPDRRERRPR